jgi:sterol desaturase/sphingolipid hydroxylase (fatty acid hydroxylase superfamily)
MSHPIQINHDEEPIRLFQSNFLEFFTHVTPVTILVIYVPAVVYLMVLAVRSVQAGMSAWVIPAGILLGMFLWTFAEYTLHRFVFHFHPRNAAQERLAFLFHGVHHAQPQCKTRLVMPPVVSLPLALLFYGLFVLVFGVLLGAPNWVSPLVIGFLVGYLAYDLTHYATHHFAMRSGYLKYLKRYHMQHHYKTPEKRFGVTSPVWDSVFGTKPA